ncbi:hypothetical protein GQ55_8G018700 [Panicum hallii var. hallii]|uniref:Ubiquitin-like protease family profile domain-containing protein n=1 Tax=Panicum hallii var. hallii TaxID=1504633 RepID=A0A2T7CJN4_9POAL|nr:hypothetical protein GQ55_8G018700 [Panicum hallii var. hallii]
MPLAIRLAVVRVLIQELGIPLPYQRAGAQARVPGRKRTSMTVRSAKDDNKRRRRELTGGGAGGPPDVPEWFIKWEQRDDELQCNAVQHHLSELGLRVWQQSYCPATAPYATQDPAPSPDASDALAPASSDAPDPVPTPLNLRECMLRLGDYLSAAELKSLEGENLLLDGVINFFFAQMSQQEEEDIVLVPTGPSLLLGNLQDPGYVAAHAAPLRLGSCRVRLVLFPVNDNRNFDQADGGNHWSLLVLHITADGSSCRIKNTD